MYDLSVHDLHEAIQSVKKNYRWSSIQIDSRQITLGDKAYSLMTDNSYDINEEKPLEETDSEEEKKQSAEKLNKNSIDRSIKPIEEEKGQAV